jgi:hypothetical protein
VTSLAEAQQACYVRFLAQWSGTAAGNVVFENEGHAAVDAQELPWVRVSVQETGGGQESLGPTGSRKYRRRARVAVQVFTPDDSGARQGALLAEQARAIFEGSAFSDLDFYDATVTPQGLDEKWLVTVMLATFEFYETK